MGDGGIALGVLGGETRKYGSTEDKETLVSRTLILSSDDVRYRIIFANHSNLHHDHHHSKITASDHDEEDKGRVTD